jgi:hypothetical protein
VALSVTPDPEVEPLDFLKVAPTLRSAVIENEQEPVPLQAEPDQPSNVEPGEGWAVSVTVVPAANEVVQVEPQLMAEGDEITVPVPLPLPTTVSAYCVVVGGGGVGVGVGSVGVVAPAEIDDPLEAAMPNFIAGAPDWCAPTSGVAASSLKLGMRAPRP